MVRNCFCFLFFEFPVSWFYIWSCCTWLIWISCHSCSSLNEFVNIQTGLFSVQLDKHVCQEVRCQMPIKESYCTYFIGNLHQAVYRSANQIWNSSALESIDLELFSKHQSHTLIYLMLCLARCFIDILNWSFPKPNLPCSNFKTEELLWPFFLI